MFFCLGISYAQTATPTATATASVSSLDGNLYEGRFHVQEGDDPELVKGILIRQATLAAIVKELKNQNLDSVSFLRKLDTLFLNEVEGISERSKKLAKLIPFGGVAQALSQYEIKEEGISKDNPSERFIRLSGKTDPQMIRALYYKIIREGESFRFNSLILIPEFDLSQISLGDIFVENEGILISSLGDSWKKWLSESFSKVVPEVKIGGKELDRMISLELKNSKRSPEFQDTLYLRLKCRVEKVNENLSLGEREFVLRGEYALMNMDTNVLVDSGNIDEKRFLVQIHSESPASVVASEIYRFPLTSFVNLPKKLDAVNFPKQKTMLQVNGAKSIIKILSLIRLLETEGNSLKLKASLQTYSGSATTSLDLSYQSDSDTFAKFVKSVEQKVTDEGDHVGLTSTSPLVFELKAPGGK